MLQALQAKLQEAESKLQALEQSGKATAHAAQQRQVAVEERARLSEQVRQLPQLTPAVPDPRCMCSTDLRTLRADGNSRPKLCEANSD